MKNHLLVHNAETPTRTVYRYQQVIGGIPVHNSQMIVQTDHNNNVKQIEYDHVTDMAVAAAPAAKAKTITAKAAYDAALKSRDNLTAEHRLRHASRRRRSLRVRTSGALRDLSRVSRPLSGRAARYNSGFFITWKRN